MDNQPHGSTIKPLPEDNDPPFSPPTPASMQAQTHQATDPDLQDEEIYEAGLEIAAGIEEPNKGSAVIGYDPMTQRHDDPNMIDDDKVDEDNTESPPPQDPA